MTLELIARHRLGLRGRLHRIEVQEAGSRLTLQVEDIGDIHVLREVFADRTYELPPEIERHLRGGSPVVADLGSHIGASVAWFRTHYPGARILGFEPNPRSFCKLASVVAEWPSVEVRPVAIAGTSGRRSLSIPGGEQINASL